MDIAHEELLASIFPSRPFGPPPSDGEVEQWTLIHGLFGQAMLWAQAYEDGLSRLVVAAEARWKRSGKNPDDIWKMTLGQLQKESLRYSHLDAYQLVEQANLLKVRNSIAHNFYRRRMGRLETHEGREQVIRELCDAIRLFQMERDEMYWLLSSLTGQPLL